MPFVVLRDSVVVDEVVAGKQLWSQVGVVEVDAGVDDRDLDRGRAPADVPGSGNPQRRQILLLGPKARIVRSRERVAGVVQLDGSDRRLGLEPLPDARGVRHFDERERCSVDERPGDPAVAGQRGFPLGFLRLEGFQLFLPLGGLVESVRGFVELHEALKGFLQAHSVLGWNPVLALLHALVASEQERLGLGVLLLTQQTSA